MTTRYYFPAKWVQDIRIEKMDKDGKILYVRVVDQYGGVSHLFLTKDLAYAVVMNSLVEKVDDDRHVPAFAWYGGAGKGLQIRFSYPMRDETVLISEYCETVTVGELKKRIGAGA